MTDWKRLERIITGGNPGLRKELVRETTLEFAKQNLAWLEEELRKVKVQLEVEEEYGGRGPARPPPFRIPSEWALADQLKMEVPGEGEPDEEDMWV